MKNAYSIGQDEHKNHFLKRTLISYLVKKKRVKMEYLEDKTHNINYKEKLMKKKRREKLSVKD